MTQKESGNGLFFLLDGTECSSTPPQCMIFSFSTLINKETVPGKLEAYAVDIFHGLPPSTPAYYQKQQDIPSGKDIWLDKFFKNVKTYDDLFAGARGIMLIGAEISGEKPEGFWFGSTRRMIEAVCMLIFDKENDDEKTLVRAGKILLRASQDDAVLRKITEENKKYDKDHEPDPARTAGEICIFAKLYIDKYINAEKEALDKSFYSITDEAALTKRARILSILDGCPENSFWNDTVRSLLSMLMFYVYKFDKDTGMDAVIELLRIGSGEGGLAKIDGIFKDISDSELCKAHYNLLKTIPEKTLSEIYVHTYFSVKKLYEEA